jgi:IS5 family transposase
MRETCQNQTEISYPWLKLDHARELQALSNLLDQSPMIAQLVHQDLCGDSTSIAGAKGLSADQIFRAFLLKQMHRWSYDELHFHLADSQTFHTFCRLSLLAEPPARATLAGNIKRIKAETLETINRLLVVDACNRHLEKAATVRIDCTVVESNIHPPSDSSLLWDSVRVLTRLMRNAQEELGPVGFHFSDRQRRAKRRDREISSTGSAKVRRKAYRDLVKVTEEVRDKAQQAVALLQTNAAGSLIGIAMSQELSRFITLAGRVLDQTRRRIFDGESVPACEKVVSIFEEHTDIIRKDRRETYFGHKVCLSTGASSMVLDCQILDGNPADSTLTVTAITRHQEIFGKPPRQAAFDGAFASKANLKELKELGVRDAVFSKKRGLEISEMAKSTWVYRRLRKFRAGVEGCISFLKRSFGLDRCTWRSLRSFKSYVWGSIVSCNLLLMARALTLKLS